MAGVIVAPEILQARLAVRHATLRLERGRVSSVSAEAGEAWIRQRIQDVGADGGLIGTVFINTHPLTERPGVVLDIGANWENGGSNRAVGMRRMTVRLTDATIVAGSRTIMRDGRLVLDDPPTTDR